MLEERIRISKELERTEVLLDELEARKRINQEEYTCQQKIEIEEQQRRAREASLTSRSPTASPPLETDSSGTAMAATSGEQEREQALERLAEEFSSHGNHSSLEAFFQHLDLDGNGTIETQELQQGLEVLGVRLSKDSVGKLMESVGASSGGALTYEQFVKIVNERSHWEKAKQSEVEDLIREAKHQTEQGHVDIAIALYEEVVRQDDMQQRRVLALSCLGALHHSSGHLDKAKECYEDVLVVQPDRYQTIYNLGRLAHDLGQLDESKGRYEQVLALNPDVGIACNALAFLGLLHQDNGKFEEARKCYSSALALNAQHTRTLCHQCALLVSERQLDKAKAQHGLLCSIDPRHASPAGGTCPYRDALALDSIAAAMEQAAAVQLSPTTSAESSRGSKGKGSKLWRKLNKSLKNLTLERYIEKQEERSAHGLSGQVGGDQSAHSTKSNGDRSSSAAATL